MVGVTALDPGAVGRRPGNETSSSLNSCSTTYEAELSAVGGALGAADSPTVAERTGWLGDTPRGSKAAAMEWSSISEMLDKTAYLLASVPTCDGGSLSAGEPRVLPVLRIVR